jgi:hypothetical protein
MTFWRLVNPLAVRLAGARSGPRLVGVDPALLRIELQDVDARGTA